MPVPFDDQTESMVEEGSPPDDVRTPAWLLQGLTGNVPGTLELSGRRLRFLSREGLLFDSPLSEVGDLVFPWYYFGGGVKLTAGGVHYRLTFVRPNGTQVFDAPNDYMGLDNGDSISEDAARAVPSILDGRSAGKVWKTILEGGDPVVKRV